MVEYFTDEAGGHRYRIRGRNGEPMVTSEGYTTARDARRGYEDLRTLLCGGTSMVGAKQPAGD
jgi:hypothetical protein